MKSTFALNTKLNLSIIMCQGFDSASTDTGTGQDGDKEDGDETDEKDKQHTENRSGPVLKIVFCHIVNLKPGKPTRRFIYQ